MVVDQSRQVGVVGDVGVAVAAQMSVYYLKIQQTLLIELNSTDLNFENA